MPLSTPKRECCAAHIKAELEPAAELQSLLSVPPSPGNRRDERGCAPRQECDGLVGMVDVDSWIARRASETFFNMAAHVPVRSHRATKAKRVVRLFA